MKLPDLEAWAIFAKVAELRSFTAAAEALGLSKATVSKAVTRLENRLGVQLFHRTSRRLSLSATGQALAHRAATMLGEAEAAEEAAREESTGPSGLVRIAAPMSFGRIHLGPALPDLLAACPHLTIDLQLSDATIDLVAEGFDMALRIGALPDSSLRVRRLCDIPRRIVGAPAYFDRHGRPDHPAQLAGHACVGYAYLADRDRWRFTGPRGEEIMVRPTGPLLTNNGEAVVPALLAGHVVALMPDFIVAGELARGELEPVLSEWALPPIALHLVTPPGAARPARVRAVIDFLVARLGR